MQLLEPYKLKLLLYAFGAGTLRWLANSDVVCGIIQAKMRPALKARLPIKPEDRLEQIKAKLVSLTAPSTPQLVCYRIEEHTTPKTKEAKKYWNDLPLEEKEVFIPNISKLKKIPGFESHWDIRIQEPNSERFVSFATFKCCLPQSGEKQQWFQTTAKHGWHKANPAMLESGYGQGITKMVYEGQALLWSSSDGIVHFHPDCTPQPLVLIPDAGWNSVLVFQKERPSSSWIDRPWEMKDISSNQDKLDFYLNDPDWIATRKYDGANFCLIISEGKTHPHVRLVSRRPHHVDGKPTMMGIDQSTKLSHLKFANIPSKYWDAGSTMITCEIYSDSTGKGNWENPLSYITSVLNSHPVRAELLQQEHGRLKVKMLYVRQLNGNPVNSGFHDQLDTMESIHREIPTLRVPKYAKTPEAKLKLLEGERIREFGEGIVFHHASFMPGYCIKYKFKHTWEFKIQDVIPVSPTSQNSKWLDENGNAIGAGCFILSNGQAIKIPCDEMKKAAWDNPMEFMGRTIEVQGMSLSNETGKIRAPVFIRMHQDK